MLEYIDVDSYKAEILTEERKRIRHVQRYLAEQKKQRKREARISVMRRIIGFGIVIGCIAIAYSGLFYGEDSTVLLLFAFVGLLIAFEGLGSWIVFATGRILSKIFK